LAILPIVVVNVIMGYVRELRADVVGGCTGGNRCVNLDGGLRDEVVDQTAEPGIPLSGSSALDQSGRQETAPMGDAEPEPFRDFTLRNSH